MTGSDDGVNASPATTGSLARWWRVFKTGTASTQTDKATQANVVPRVFGVPLQTSLAYASVAISQIGTDGKARVHGIIPTLVAKTGLFLKENGTTTQGVFRVSGSAKRIKQLEEIFDNPPLYGKDLQWDCYSVHDAASILRRYLMMLPEPVVPYELYTSFQEPLPRNKDGTVSTDPAKLDAAVTAYRRLIDSLPPASQHVFYYLLDLLGVFAKKSDQNLMTASNLAVIFQPALLRHRTAGEPMTSISPSPLEDTDSVKAHIEADAREHKRSQEVLDFLISRRNDFELELPEHVKQRVLASPTISERSRTELPAPIPMTVTTPAASTLPTPTSFKPASPVPVSATKEVPPHVLAVRRVQNVSESKLHRRGSDKSEHRRQQRRKKADAAMLGATDAVTVKRSRTLDAKPSPKLPSIEGRPRTAIATGTNRLQPEPSPLSPEPSPLSPQTSRAMSTTVSRTTSHSAVGTASDLSKSQSSGRKWWKPASKQK